MDVEVFLPVAFVTSSKFGEDGEMGATTTRSMGLKCGPRTIKLSAVTIAASKTIIWNGPIGGFSFFFFEMESFEAGTQMMMHIIAATVIPSVVIPPLLAGCTRPGT